jgi:hypothetical protein
LVLFLLSCYYAMGFKAYTTKPLLRSTQHFRKLHQRLKIIEENIPTDRRINLAKRLLQGKGKSKNKFSNVGSPVRRGRREGFKLPASLSAFCLPGTRLPSGFNGLVVSMLSSGTQDRGFAPGRSCRIFRARKILSMPSFGRKVRPFAACCRFVAC